MIPALDLPAFIWLRKVDYDEQADSIGKLSRKTPLLFVKIKGVDCFPIFSTEKNARELLSHLDYNDAVVPCDLQRLKHVLTVTQPPVILFDPTIHGENFGYALKDIIEWMQESE